MDIGKKEEIMVDWFRKRLDEWKKGWNREVYLISDKYDVQIGKKDMRLIGSNLGKGMDRGLKYLLFSDGKVEYLKSIEFVGYLGLELREEQGVNWKGVNGWEQEQQGEDGIR